MDETLGQHLLSKICLLLGDGTRCSNWLKSENVGNGMNQRQKILDVFMPTG